MAIPLLGYPLSTQNGRVSNLAGDNSTVQSQLYPCLLYTSPSPRD